MVLFDAPKSGLLLELQQQWQLCFIVEHLNIFIHYNFLSFLSFFLFAIAAQATTVSELFHKYLLSAAVWSHL